MDMLVEAGSNKTVRWAIPSTIITAAKTNATMAKTKRTYEPSCAASVKAATNASFHDTPRGLKAS
jgi:hypothetical protein